MTTRIGHCDRCGERIEDQRTLVTVETGAIRQKWTALDLCAPCAHHFQTWMEQGRGAAAGTTPGGGPPPSTPL